MSEHRTEAQLRCGAIHYLDLRGLSKDEAGEAMENINRLLAESARQRASENEKRTNQTP